jgi:superfamily II DNA or RNA helicase
MPDLRPYQVEALATAEAAAATGRCWALVVLPTGTGKTLVFAELVRRRGGRALVVAHRDELLSQAGWKLVQAGIPKADIGLVKAGRDELDRPVVLASVQTLARKSRRERLIRAQAEHGYFRTVVIDEAHHAPAPSYKALLADLDAGAQGRAEPFVLGVTATPSRKGVHAMFGEPVYSRDLVDMIAEGWLCDLRGRRVGIDLDLGQVRKKAGDYLEADLARALGEADAPEAVAAAWAEHAEGRPTLCFTAGVELAHETAEALRRKGARAEALNGTTAPEERRAMLTRYAKGKTSVLVNCAVLTEGVDLPHTACVVIARPTLSPLLYAQMIGRGSRLAPAKADCLVLDLAGATAQHDLRRLGMAEPASLRSLTGLTVKDGQSLLSVALADRRRRERLEALLAQHGRLVAADVDLFGRQQLRWLTLPGETPTYVLGIGDAGQVVLVPDGPATFAAHRVTRDEAVTLGEHLRTDQATALAERLVLDNRAGHLADAGARWRQKPASTDQVRVLVSARRVPRDVAATLTRGQASDLLDAVFAERSLKKAGLVA